MAKIFLFLALALLLVWLWRRRPAAGRDPDRKTLVFGAIVVVLLGLALTGRLGWAAALVGGLAAALVRVLPRILPIALRYAPALQRLWHAWRSGQTGRGPSSPRPPASSGMRPEEALAVLGLEPGATPAQIIHAHRRLMQKFHPDRGGSDDLATRINRARDTLLGQD